MKLKLLRYSDNGNSTLGLLFIDNEFFCYTLEDEFREVKVKGETRIPSGTYQLIINNDLTGLTEKYRKKYNWFKNHIQLKDVSGFNNVYIHVGNYETNTDGCILLGNSANNNQIEKGVIGSSVPAFKQFYFNIFPLLKGEEKITIEVCEVKL